ncbi:MAG: acyl-CoA dehydrogenase family protein [Mycobacterium sp.]|uniref:acyl-CoA dehydrogenase family protein n=1 Tax=Mycobacterium sp. TaxID=1785 RepID=UPI003C569959
MDLRLSESEDQLARELRSWLPTVLPAWRDTPPIDDWDARKSFDQRWQRFLHDAGYAGFSWPQRFGGREASPIEELVFAREMSISGAPDIGVNFVGLMHAGPTLMAEGSDEQRARYLPAILRGEEVWCQGFSEPSAGSDLAALTTRAVRDGEDYVITGHKVWSSYAHVADFCEMLVRTDPLAPRHGGISWLIVPMDAPGIQVRPLRTLTGSTEFCEVFLDGVRVPITNRVGDENDGWRVAMVTLGFERGTAMIHEYFAATQLAAVIKTTAISSGSWDDSVRSEHGLIVAQLDALWALTVRNVSQAARHRPPGVGGSVFKLRFSEVYQQLGDLGRRVIAGHGLALEDVSDIPAGTVLHERLYGLCYLIAGGTSQVQRSILAERALGMPKEPRWTSN